MHNLSFYNRVETEREIPKLKLDIGCGDSIQKSILKVLFNSEISYLQEFQYGKETAQTTTNISKKVRRNVNEVRELYSLN